MSLTKVFSKDQKTCKVTFSLPTEAAPTAKQIKVVGDFNNWAWSDGVVLKKSETEFKGSTTLEAGHEYEFRYLIDQESWTNDWAADAYRPAPFDGIENSVVILPATHKKESIAITKKASATTTEKKVEPVKKAAQKKAAAPKATSKNVAPKTSSTKADDLTKIEGIGPKIKDLLVADKIVTFADLASSTVTNLKDILTKAGSRYTMHDPSTWAKQAKLAASGNWDKLKTLQDELKGGKVAKK